MNPNWKHATLADSVSDIIDYRGKTPTKTTFGVPLVTAKIVKNGRIDEATEFIAAEEYDSWMRRGLPQVGDVLITTEAPLGEVAQITNAKVALAQRIILLRGKPDRLDNTFLKYALLDDDLQNQLQVRTSGTTVTGIKQSELRKVIVPLPPLPEQRAIASILGSLDEKIELNRRQNATLEAMAQRVFRAWFVDFEPVRAKVAGIAPACLDPETAALFPDEWEDETETLPKGWTLRRLEEAFEINPTRRNPGASYLDMANVPTQGHHPNAVTQRAMGSGMKFTNGDTLLARITPCLENGKTAFVDFLKENEVGWGSTEFIVLRPKPPLPEYFGYLLCREEEFRQFAIQSMTGTSGRQRVQNNQLAQYQIAVPKLEIADKFAEIVNPLAAQIAANAEQSRTLAAIRDQLLPRLLSGALRVPEALISGDADAVSMVGNPNLELGF